MSVETSVTSQRAIKKAGRPVNPDLRLYAERYGVSDKVIFRIGLKRLNAMSEDSRLVLIGEAKRQVEKQRVAREISASKRSAASHESEFFGRMGARIAILRRRRGLSIDLLAERSSVHPNTLIGIESGKSCSVSSLLKIATGLGVEVQELMQQLTKKCGNSSNGPHTDQISG